ncbi:MAG: hypothetical protein ACE5HI_11255 [bacterium]
MTLVIKPLRTIPNCHAANIARSRLEVSFQQTNSKLTEAEFLPVAKKILTVRAPEYRGITGQRRLFYLKEFKIFNIEH